MVEEFDLAARNKAIADAVQKLDQDTKRGTPSSATPAQIKAMHGAQLFEFGQREGNRAQMAEGLALQGEFELATQFAEGAHLAEYEKLSEAVGNPAPCDCPRFSGNGANRSDNRLLRDQYQRGGEEINVYVCLLCGNYEIR
jgi:hypothetical protein